jgi:putative transposase
MSKDGMDLIELKDSVLEQVLGTLLLIWPVGLNLRKPVKDILRSVIWAAVRCTSVHRACKDMEEGPCGKTVRTYIQMHRIQSLLRKIPRLLMIPVRNILRPGKYKFAADITLIPYHGKPRKNINEIVRSKAKGGTTHFHGYASLYVILHNKRVTLDVVWIRKNTDLIKVLDRFIKRIEKEGYGIKLLFLDKGFFQARIIEYLQVSKIPAVIPAVPRGRSGGIRKKLGTSLGYRTSYTMRSLKYECEVTFALYVVRKYCKNRYERSGSKIFSYAVLNTRLPVEKVFGEYRNRFGIESSYRLMNSCRIRTSSRNPTYRLYLVFVSFLIINYWVASQWLYISEPRKGGRKIYKDELALPTFRRLLDKAIERRFGLKTFLICPEWKPIGHTG